MKWSLGDVLILVSMAILISILTSNIEAVEYTFTDVPMTKKLPVWLAYIHTNTTADKFYADGIARELMNSKKQAIDDATDRKYFRTKEAQERFNHAFQGVNDNTMNIPDGIAELVHRALDAAECARGVYSIDAMTGDHTIQTEEEKVMIWTMIRIMAYYMFNNHKDFGALINATDSTPVMEMNFNVPDSTLIPSYFLMSQVNRQAHFGGCPTERPEDRRRG